MRRLIGPAAALALAACGPLALVDAFAASEAGHSLDFYRTFVRDKEPAGLHFKAAYRDARGDHHVEVWRDGQRQLHRQTDGALDLFVQRKDAHDPAFEMVVLDHRRRIRTNVSRGSLAEMGHAADWFSLAHGMAMPSGPYQLVPLRGAPPSIEPASRCDWYTLSSAGRESLVCWSRRYALPLLIINARTGQLNWTVKAVEAASQPAARFQIDDAGFAHVDANRDLQAD
jgi:hypothetical protein